MITLFIWLLTALLVITSLFLILLVLVQLPKKEAGAGLAFGAGAADALLGAGSGNALTKVTKYTVVAFFLLSITLGIAFNHARSAKAGGVAKVLATSPIVGAPAAPVVNSAVTPPTNSFLTTTPAVSTNRPAGTNTPAR